MKWFKTAKIFLQLKNKEDWPHWREVFVALLSGVIITFGEALGLEGVANEVIALIGGSYAASGFLAGTNPKKKLEGIGRKLNSKKFRATLLTMAVTVLSAQFGIDVDWALGMLASVFNIGVGYADSKEDREPQPSVVVLPARDDSNNTIPSPNPPAEAPTIFKDPPKKVEYNVVQHETPNHGGKIDPQGIVFHHSGGSLEGSISWIKNPESEVSYHMMIDQDGTQHVLLPFTTKAWHAGKSIFNGMEHCNNFMIGIAFEGDTNKRELTDAEIDSAVQVVKVLKDIYNIPFHFITDHRQVSATGKVDLNPEQFDRLRTAIATRVY